MLSSKKKTNFQNYNEFISSNYEKLRCQQPDLNYQIITILKE